jgi:hypothetical protein
MLLTIERTAPNRMKYQSYPQTIVRELLERERRSRTPAAWSCASAWRGIAAPFAGPAEDVTPWVCYPVAAD